MFWLHVSVVPGANNESKVLLLLLLKMVNRLTKIPCGSLWRLFKGYIQIMRRWIVIIHLTLSE